MIKCMRCVEVGDRVAFLGDRMVFPALHVPATECKGEAFPEIDLKDVSATCVHVEPHRVIYCFDGILFKHDIDSECSGKPFDETPLAAYLTGPFTDALMGALSEQVSDVKVSLLSEENVFDEASADFMPYFKPVMSRIKVLADKNATGYWWLRTPYASDSAYFDIVHDDGSSGYNLAGNSTGGVVPCFEIIGK